MRSLFFFLALFQLSPHVLGAFHLFTRYERIGSYDCKTGKTCFCEFEVEWRMGAVPSQNYNCDGFMNDNFFTRTIGQGEGWNTNYPSICGSKPVDMYVTNGGNNLEVWEHNATPGKLLAKCSKQGDGISTICGNPGDPFCPTGKTEANDIWVCSETELCN